MPEASGLKFGPLTDAVHLCVDMQRLFADDTPWRTPWMREVLPQVVRLCEHRPARCCFTRFIPPASPDRASGAWRRYYQRWEAVTRDVLGVEMIELLPELAIFVPPGRVLDKPVYSPWFQPELHAWLGETGVRTVVVSGGETDVCVLATVLGAVDHGYRVVIAVDALCSSSDRDHDLTLALYNDRFGQQIETASVEEIVDAWP